MKMFLDSTFSKHEIMAYKHLRKARDKAKFLLYDIFITVCESEVTQSCPSFCDPMNYTKTTKHLHPWCFPGKDTAVGCHFLLQGCFPS